MLLRTGKRFALIALVLSISLGRGAAAISNTPAFGVVDVGNGVALHYVQAGHGMPIVFVHGSLSDFSYWKDQIEAFSTHYRAIAYSRRYNWPNNNPVYPNYSAITDADDLAAFIEKMHLGRVDVIGHSYGALAALFLATRHPELLHSLVLAEPPAISLLLHLPGGQSSMGKAMFDDIQRRMVAPMERDFREDDTQAGVADFIDYVFNNPRAWSHMSPEDHQATLRDAREWNVMMTSGHLFPNIDPRAIRKISVPVLLMTGSKTYPFLRPIMKELAVLIPHSQTLVVYGAGHQMWYQQPDLCRRTVETFLRRQ